MDKKPLVTPYVQDVVRRTGTTIKDVARMGYENLCIAKTAYPDVWEKRDEYELGRLREFAEGKFVSESYLEGRITAEVKGWLTMYGGSKRKQAIGLQMMAEKEAKEKVER